MLKMLKILKNQLSELKSNVQKTQNTKQLTQSIETHNSLGKMIAALNVSESKKKTLLDQHLSIGKKIEERQAFFQRFAEKMPRLTESPPAEQDFTKIEEDSTTLEVSTDTLEPTSEESQVTELNDSSPAAKNVDLQTHNEIVDVEQFSDNRSVEEMIDHPLQYNEVILSETEREILQEDESAHSLLIGQVHEGSFDPWRAIDLKFTTAALRNIENKELKTDLTKYSDWYKQGAISLDTLKRLCVAKNLAIFEESGELSINSNEHSLFQAFYNAPQDTMRLAFILKTIAPHLEQLRKKAEVLVDGEARTAINALIQEMNKEIFNYAAHTTTLDRFKANTKDLINTAHEKVDIHRGWKEVLQNLAFAIGTLGIVYGAVALCKWTLFPISSKTESAKKLDGLENALENMQSVEFQG